MTGAGATAMGRAHRGRTWLVTVLVGAVLGTGLLLWGLDRLARSTVQALLAEELQEATGTVQTPTVEVQGGPVLLQALRGRYEEVAVTMGQVSNGPLTFDRVQAELHGVHLSFHDLLVRDADAVVFERSAADASLSYDALDRYLRFTGRPMTVRPEGPATADELRLTATGQLLDRPYDASATAVVEPTTGALVVRPTEVRTDRQLDRSAELLLAERFRFRVPLDPLPFGQEVADVELGEGRSPSGRRARGRRPRLTVPARVRLAPGILPAEARRRAVTRTPGRGRRSGGGTRIRLSPRRVRLWQCVSGSGGGCARDAPAPTCRAIGTTARWRPCPPRVPAPAADTEQQVADPGRPLPLKGSASRRTSSLAGGRGRRRSLSDDGPAVRTAVRTRRRAPSGSDALHPPAHLCDHDVRMGERQHVAGIRDRDQGAVRQHRQELPDLVPGDLRIGAAVDQ
ncbi:DUF2993 domain-containing protein [Blastococcus brunescens]|uniref:DUF2993 domain-containing protein n=1 Tax=Blastococcus brunescens TaxID=1564165 RepID=A0ABZ1B6J2_9ACTN|nr:DUF2993 domain-containing protein [Blastococcus sp. BMG 8361]WRL66359.1 DUF2993 domain-containing protein [Blastococcus sp. BMG 8361]